MLAQIGNQRVSLCFVFTPTCLVITGCDPDLSRYCTVVYIYSGGSKGGGGSGGSGPPPEIPGKKFLHMDK